MLVTVTIKLTSPFLGSSKPNAEGIREIIKSDANKPTLFIKHFCKLCKRYARELGIPNFKYNTINVPNFLKTTNEEIIYSKVVKDFDGSEKEEKFYAYPVGSIMTLECCVDTRIITVEKAVKILELIGKYSGISQFGVTKNFGRFDILLCQSDNGNN